IYVFLFYFFFFSSRRRHTRSLRDWSSDVCSSDLIRHTITVCIAAYTMRINRRTGRRIWFVVELIRYTVAITVVKYGFWQLHMIRLVDLVISVVKRIDPPERFNGFGSQRYVNTCRNKVV